MKSRFSTIDIKAVLHEIKTQFSGLRVANVYDVDNKTYLIKFTKPDSKKVLLIESGIRIHITEYDWPKGTFPSGFSMKLRKHLKSRRLEEVVQLGTDRIVRLQFGTSDAAYHVILELYDRGNIVLTDYEFNILNILRPRADNSQDVRFAVREKYPLELAKNDRSAPTMEMLHELLAAAKPNENLRKILNPALAYGPAVIDHCLQSVGFPGAACLGKDFDITTDTVKLFSAIQLAEEIMDKVSTSCDGYIIQKVEKKPGAASGEDNSENEILVNDEFHPCLFKQHESRRYAHFASFNQAVDQFYSQMEAQKIEMKSLQAEKSALKKLDNVKKDHEKRLQELKKDQETDEQKANLIQINLDMVDKAIAVVRSALANQIGWKEIDEIIKEAQSHGDVVAKAIKSLKLEKNHISMLLRDQFDEDDSQPLVVDIDLSLSAYGNAKKYYGQKKFAVQKEQKTMDASKKAFKSAEKKTKQALKEMKVTASIVKARKVMWFEKFNWFITSENYLVLAGRDGQQNEILVRRYLKSGDVYVHADIHGASSVIVKNPSGAPIPPKTLNEAGTMAICHSAAWEAKVVTSAWWVYHDQVSKTAPSGEYLTTGSFMIRGKKNFLPPSYLVYGFGLLFKLDEDSVERHKGERKVRQQDDDNVSVITEPESDLIIEEELPVEEDSGDEPSGDESSGAGPNGAGPSGADPSSDDKNASDDGITDEELVEKDGIVSDGSEDLEDSNKAISGTNFAAEDTKSEVEIQKSLQQLEMDKNEREDNSKERDKSDNSGGEDDFAFPDTQLDLRPVSGMKFEIRHRSISQISSTSDSTQNDGMITPTDSEPGSSKESKPALSRKQRRDLKKQKKRNALGIDNDDDTIKEVEHVSKIHHDNAKTGQNLMSEERLQSSLPDQKPKRGQHGKMKKMKKKYNDQDEEERSLRTSLLHAAEKETKKRQKMKAQKHQAEEQRARREEQQRKYQEKKANHQQASKAAAVSSVPEAMDDETDDLTAQVDIDVLDTLTGIPMSDDTLLYAIPFCAPYASLQNFKYKVKLVPGSTKRGKAVKTAVQAFMFDKDITQREKDLIKSLKDVDMSRNVPGKVKVSSSQVNRAKAKK